MPPKKVPVKKELIAVRIRSNSIANTLIVLERS